MASAVVIGEIFGSSPEYVGEPPTGGLALLKANAMLYRQWVQKPKTVPVKAHLWIQQKPENAQLPVKAH